MIFIKGFGAHGEKFSAKIEQNEVSGKYCGQVYYSGERGPFFGWCNRIADVEQWIAKKMEDAV